MGRQAEHFRHGGSAATATSQTTSRRHDILERPRFREEKGCRIHFAHDGRTFGDRCMVESYQADGAYTGAAEVENDVVVLVYYSDRVRAHCPDLVQTVLRIG